MKLVCPDCGRQYESGKFCPECGGKLQEVTPVLVCPSCGYKAKSGKFCPECGTKLTEQLPTEEETVNTKSAERTFNEKDPRFAKYYDRKGFPRTIPQEERDVAIEELTPYVNQNIAEAKMLLGSILLSDSTNKDACLKGAKLIKEAEAAGDKFAYYLMGFIYYATDQNHSEAEKRLLELYKEYENGDAAQLLAELYALSTEKCDYKKAFDYATIAAEDDECGGYLVLGSLYLNGWGVEKNVNKALENYKMAAALGDETAMNQIGIIYMGSEEFEANLEQSFYWFNEAAKKGSDVGMYNLGCCYRDGFGIKADVEQAAEWFKKSAELGYVDAMVELGEYYQAILVDFEKSKMWYLKAAELGNAKAQDALGVLCANDNDYKEAVKWYKRAMEQDDYWAYWNYAHCLWNGNGVQENKKKAMEMMQKAISLGHPNAEDELKEMQQALAKSKKEDAKDPQAKKKQVKKKTEVVRIENVNFSTDGRKYLLMEFEVEDNRGSDYWIDHDIEFCVYANNKWIDSFLATCQGALLSKTRAKFSWHIADYELSLKTNTTNKLSLTIEAYQLDERWDGTQDPKMFPVVASHKTNLKLYYESHIFGKNVLEIK